jgi:hypothetical protein
MRTVARVAVVASLVAIGSGCSGGLTDQSGSGFCEQVASLVVASPQSLDEAEAMLQQVADLLETASISAEDRSGIAAVLSITRDDLRRFRTDATAEWSDTPLITTLNSRCSAEFPVHFFAG